jgi:hypothetical protein
VCIFQSKLQAISETGVFAHIDDSQLGRPALVAQIFPDRRDRRFRRFPVLIGDQDDSNPRAREWHTLAVGCEGVMALVGCRHVHFSVP